MQNLVASGANKCHLGYKILCEKEEMLVTSNFSFSHNVFLQLYIFHVAKCGMCGYGISTAKVSKPSIINAPISALIETGNLTRDGNGYRFP